MISVSCLYEDLSDWLDAAKKVSKTIADKSDDVGDAAKKTSRVFNDDGDNSITKTAKKVSQRSRKVGEAARGIKKLLKW